MPPHFLRGSSALVIRCFKRVEAFADWITGAAGPVFVVLCWTLVGGGGFAFFDVVARDMSFQTFLIGSPIFILTPLNLYGQYYLVTAVPPGFPSPKASGVTKREARWLIPNSRSLWSAERWGFRRRGKMLSGGNSAAPRRVRRCRKCDGPKPERTHHCSVCKRCVLQMDHHCPWINACVGLHNQRYFVLFMAWLSLACWNVAFLGYSKFWDSLDARAKWPSYTPSIMWTLIWVLSVAIGIAVPILGSWHVWMVAAGETSIESHDNDYLAGKAKAEGLIYLNPFDLGKRRNLEIFFSLGKDGYPWTTLLLPLVIAPMSNGWSYPRRSLPSAPAQPKEMDLHSPELAEGLIGTSHAENGMGTSTKYVMDDGGYDLTDDEEGGGGWMDVAPHSPS